MPSIRRTLKGFGLVLAILVIAAALIYGFRHALIAPLLSAWIERQISNQTGLTIDIGRIRGTYFDQIIVEDLVTRAASPTTPLQRIGLKRLEATYSLPALLNGYAAFVRSLVLDLEDPDLSLDWRFSSAEAQKPVEKNRSLCRDPACFPGYTCGMDCLTCGPGLLSAGWRVSISTWLKAIPTSAGCS